MTRKPVSDLARLHNAQNHAVDSSVTQQKRPSATGLKRAGASRSLDQVLASLGLNRRRLTPLPAEFRNASRPPNTGARRVAGKQSAYASPLGARVERRGQLVELRAHLAAVRVAVIEGASLLEAVADGTLWGWRSREALSHVIGAPLANWDRERGRTQGERLAVVERALGELGADEKVRRGGWSVSS